MRTFGVEEEYLLVDATTGEARSVARQVLRRAVDEQHREGFDAEIQQEMLELVTEPQSTLAGMLAAIRANRASADELARELGARIVALASPPLAVEAHAMPGERYQRILEHYGMTARESLTCGQHVHVSVESREEAVAVLDRIRVWLPVVLALSTNSPYSAGQDTGHASYRAQLWRRWPTANPTPHFGSVEALDAYEREMLDTGVLLDENMLHFEARASKRYPTVEVRVADVSLFAETSASIAALIRGLVGAAADEWKRGIEPPKPSTDTLRLASWRASISGVDGELVHPLTGRPASARDVVQALAAHVAGALAETGDEVAVRAWLERMLDGGTGAHWQRAAMARTADLHAVVGEAAEATQA
jgi:carboxylate-amine ligase